MAYVDPRTKGFNYGMGWTGPKPAIYHQGEQLAYQLRVQTTELSAKAWALDMALKNLRLAEDDIQRRMAIDRLTVEVAKHEQPCELMDAAE